MIRIQNLFREQVVTREVTVQRWRREGKADSSDRLFQVSCEGIGKADADGDAQSELVDEKAQTELLEEHVLAIYVNDILTMRVVCTARDLAELTLGRLLSEGVIRSVKDVSFLYICEQGLRAKAYLSQERNLQVSESAEDQKIFMQNMQSRQEDEDAPAVEEEAYVDVTLSCCTDNRTFHEDFVLEQELKPLPPGNWSPDRVFGIAGVFYSEDTPLHRRTGSTHSCFLLQGEKILFLAEDIGRHNALDKVIGWGLLHDVNLSETAVFTSGRVPADMVRKVIRAGIPVLISKELPTREAVKMASDLRLTLIGNAREDGFKVFTRVL